MARLIGLLATLVCVVSGVAMAEVSDKEVAHGLQEALTQGASKAVLQLGQADGFWNNDRLRIPLPAPLAKADKLLRRVGMGKKADELKLAMNRAAEFAVAESKPILVDAIKKMGWQDVKAILTGGDTAATDYFRTTTREPLTAKFLPIVQAATGKVKLADKYNQYASKAAKWGLLSEQDANLDQYVTDKALDGLYSVIGEQEREIRQNPMQAASDLLRRVFGRR